MNSSVEATGMSVKAAAGSGLVISGYNSDPKSDTDSSAKGWTTPGGAVALDTLNTTKRTSTLVPTSTVDADYWFTATAASSDEETVNSAGYTLHTDGKSEDDFGSSVYLYNVVKIQTNDNAAITDKHLTISSISASNGTSGSALSADLNKALRIAFVVSDGTTEKVYIYAPNEDSYPTIIGVKYDSTLSSKYKTVTVAEGKLDNAEVYGSSTSSITLFDNTVPATTTVEMYVYYDGEDANCFTNNTLSGVDTLTVSVSFTAVDNE